MSDNTPLLFILHIAGAAALLLWAVRLVRTGIERGWAVPLRRWLRRGAENRVLAAGAGTAAAVLLQSSTAVAILTANFVAAGTLAASAGFAVLLGADLGSAIVAQILLTRADWLVPVLLVAGVGLFQRSTSREGRMAGRVLIGLALIFVALTMIRAATEPLRDAPGLSTAMTYLGGDPVTAFVLGALFAWAVHSSVAAVLLFVTLASAGVLPVPAGVAMVLGANFGGAMIGFILTLGAELPARRVIFANLLVRGGGAILALLALAVLHPSFAPLGQTPARQIIHVHLLFNAGLLVLALPFTGPLTRLSVKLLAPPPTAPTLGRVSALDPAAKDQPDRALAGAAREILSMGERVETMLRAILPLYKSWDDTAAEAIRRAEAEVGHMHLETKLYLAGLKTDGADDRVGRRALDLAEMAVSLDSAGTVVSRTMVPLAQQLDHEGVAFSETGAREVADFYDRVLANAQAALNVLMTHSPDAARALVEEKDHVRDIEQSLQHSHLERLRQGQSETIETSNIHQETLRALKQVNTAFTQVAYPILSDRGDLLASRLSNRS